jgi:adenosine kinase
MDGTKVGCALMATNRTVHFGGTAGNISYNLGLLEVPHYVFSRVGKDFAELGYAQHLESPFRTLLLDTIDDDITASCYIFNDDLSNQISTFYEGAMAFKLDIDLSAQVPGIEDVQFAINAPQNKVAMLNLARELKAMDKNMIFDPGQVTPAYTREDLEEGLQGAYALISNEFEFNMISEKLGRSVDEMFELVPRIVTTRGGSGSVIRLSGEETAIPVVKPKAVKDTTGAGDGYRAGMLAGLVNNLDLEKSCKLGAVIGSFVVETVGAQTQVFSRNDVEKRFEKAFGEKLEINWD